MGDMAKRTSTAIVRTSTIPTVRIAVPRTAPMVKAPRRGAVRRRGGSIGGASSGVTPVKVAITAAVVGMVEKSGMLDKLPEIPLVGRKGAMALITYYWARHGGGQIARDVCLVTSAIVGYQFGKEGEVTG